MKLLINHIENSEIYISNLKGEPMLSKRKISSSLVSSFQKINNQDNIIDFFDLCDGQNSLNMIQNKLKLKKKRYIKNSKNFKKTKLNSKNLISEYMTKSTDNEKILENFFVKKKKEKILKKKKKNKFT